MTIIIDLNFLNFPQYNENEINQSQNHLIQERFVEELILGYYR